MTERARRGWRWWRDFEAGEDDAEAGPLGSEASFSPHAILLAESALRTRYRVSVHPSFMFISLFGMTSDAIGTRADLVDEELAQKGLIPVYLVDEAEFSPLRIARRLFEYLPSHWQGSRLSPDLDWPFYLRRRYLLLQAKWQPIGRIDFGDLPDWLPDHQDIARPADAKTPRP
ncbi:MAG: hypothetical protein ACR2P3_06500 [Geminicoccaceae bacterium]